LDNIFVIRGFNVSFVVGLAKLFILLDAVFVIFLVFVTAIIIADIITPVEFLNLRKSTDTVGVMLLLLLLKKQGL